jgi:APA family basic amino acid/polyamine antiporter
MILDADPQLKRTLGWPTAAAVVVANMVGVGAFTTSGFIARDTGSPWLVLGLWIAGGLIALMGALAFAELGAALPHAGGDYVYLREAYGPCIAYLSGWTSFFAGFSGALAATLLALAGYCSVLAPRLAVLDPRVLAILTLWLLTAVHLAGTSWSGKLQILLSAATTALIVALVVAGFTIGHGSAAHFISHAPARGHLAVSLIYVLYAYSGWNSAGYLAGEIVEPERTLPRALIWGTVCVSVLYLALNALYVWAMPISAMSGVLPIAQKAAAMALGSRASHLVAALIAVAVLSSAGAMVMAGPRIYFAMARDGAIPARLVRASSRSGPAAAIVLQAVWASVLIGVFGAFEQVVVYVGFAITIFSAATVAAVVALRVSRPAMPRPFRMPASPWLATIYVAISLCVAAYTAVSRPAETILGLMTVAGGLPIYWLMSRNLRIHPPIVKSARCRIFP